MSPSPAPQEPPVEPLPARAVRGTARWVLKAFGLEGLIIMIVLVVPIALKCYRDGDPVAAAFFMLAGLGITYEARRAMGERHVEQIDEDDEDEP